MDESTVLEVTAEGEGDTREVSISLDQGAWEGCCGTDAQAHFNAWGDMLAQMVRAISAGMEDQGLASAELSELMLIQRIDQTVSSINAPHMAKLIDFPVGDVGIN